MAIFGTEQEYGISLVGADPAQAPHPMYLSNAVIRAYRDDTAAPYVGFDVDSEAPLADMWGFHVPRDEAHPDQLTDTSPLASRMLTNGARFYVDHAHPEFSGPEVTTALDAVAYDRAGDAIMAESAAAVGARYEAPVRLFKNNTDGKGQSYGSHENYLIGRAVPFEQIVAQFTAHLVTRGVITGAGRVGLGEASEEPGYQLTQRADFFEREVSLETTMRRGIVNTRDEPHANPRTSRRLHVITGDANQSQTAVLIKVGATALVLGALEAGLLPELRLATPVAALRAASRDLTLRATMTLADGHRMTALDVQEALLGAAREFVVRQPDALADADRVLGEWQQAIDLLRREPGAAADRLDWAAKLALLERYRERDALAWDAAKLAAVDLQWAEIDPARSLAYALERAGRLRTLLPSEVVVDARTQPPAETRAWLRGTVLRRWGTDVARVGWDSITLRTRTGERTVRMTEPTAWTAAQWASRLESVADGDALWRLLDGADQRRSST